MAYDAYLQIYGPDVEGESTSSGFEDAIEIMSFSFGGSNSVTVGSGSGGSGAGKVSMNDFSVMKNTESSSCDLVSAMCNGDHFEKAVVSLRKAGGKSNKQCVFLKYTFEEVFITSVQWSGSGGAGDSPMEAVSFAYGKFTVEYFKQDAGGNVTPANNMSWDLRTNSAGD
jgi:type VI secretion system secreted protein Hcp